MVGGMLAACVSCLKPQSHPEHREERDERHYRRAVRLTLAVGKAQLAEGVAASRLAALFDVHHVDTSR